MLPPKAIVRFFLLVLVFGAVLLPRWPGVGDAYAVYFRALGNVAFARFGFWPHATVSFRDPAAIKPGDLPPGIEAPPAIGVRDTVMVLENRRVLGALGFLRTSSLDIGYAPTAMFIVLVLASPGTWRRKGKALALGLVMVQLFVVLRLSLPLLQAFCNPTKAYAACELGSFGTSVLNKVESVLHSDPTVSYVVPTFIWFLLLFRPSQWADQGSEENRSDAANNT